jgi:hypothetical protein
MDHLGGFLLNDRGGRGSLGGLITGLCVDTEAL